MTMSAVESLWKRVGDWWTSESVHYAHEFLPDTAGGPLKPQQSYFRVWMSEMFLARDRQHATDRYPALQASIRLRFAGSEGTTLSTVIRPPQGQEGPGVRRDRPLTELLPFSGGTVGLQVSLLDVQGVNHVGLALDVLQGFSSLLSPPLSTALTIAEKVAAGVDRVDSELEGKGKRPLLMLDRTLASAGADGQSGLQTGSFVVIRGHAARFPPGSLSVTGNRLLHDGQPLTGYDYFVVRVEGRDERDDWRFQEWDELIGRAQVAQLLGKEDDARALKQEVLARIIMSPDLTPIDRKRVAKVVKDEVESFQLGAAGAGRLASVADLVAQRGLPSRAATGLLTVGELLA